MPSNLPLFSDQMIVIASGQYEIPRDGRDDTHCAAMAGLMAGHGWGWAGRPKDEKLAISMASDPKDGKVTARSIQNVENR